MSGEWDKRNPEKAREYRRKWRNKNLERAREYDRGYRRRNKEKITQYHKEYYAENKEKILEQILKPKKDLKASLLHDQHYMCKICFRNWDEKDDFNKWHIDHNHQNMKIRAVLCNGCNVALGMIQEDIIALERMIEYIKNDGDIEI